MFVAGGIEPDIGFLTGTFYLCRSVFTAQPKRELMNRIATEELEVQTAPRRRSQLRGIGWKAGAATPLASPSDAFDSLPPR